MLQLINHHTHYHAGLYSGKVGAQNELICVIKRAWRFTREGDLQTINPAPAIIEVDQFRGKVNHSSLIAAREIMPYKEKGEIILYGSAQKPMANHVMTLVTLSIEWENQIKFECYKNNFNKKPSSNRELRSNTLLDQSFTPIKKTGANKWNKSLFIFGERQWHMTLFGAKLSKPKPIEAPIPLIYELAYGGCDPKKPERYYAKNPAGLGFSLQRHANNLLAPQIEISPLLTQLSDRPIPAGYAPIPIAWQIADIKQTKVPLEIHQVAPLDQRFDSYFFGGEIIKLKGLVSEIATTDEITFKLPSHQPKLSLHMDKQTVVIEPICDTVVIDTDAMTLQQIWRTGIPWEINDQRHGVLMLLK